MFKSIGIGIIKYFSLIKIIFTKFYNIYTKMWRGILRKNRTVCSHKTV